jgi:ubiquinone biosynthesis protein UbiJ
MTALPIPVLAAANHVLGQADWARERLALFAGRSARVTMPPFDALIVVLDNGFISSPNHDTVSGSEAAADVTINLPASAPLMFLQGMPTLMRAVKLSGSVDFAEALSFVIRNIKWDVEEDLSKVVGDVAAHRVVSGAKRFGSWNVGAAQNFAGNLAEYFTEEQPLIAQSAAIADFSREVDKLRDDIARLEKRLARLSRAAAVPPQR